MDKRTGRLEPFLKVHQAYSDDDNVDEAEVGDDGDDVDVHLLVGLEVLDVDADRGSVTGQGGKRCRGLHIRVETGLGRGTGAKDCPTMSVISFLTWCIGSCGSFSGAYDAHKEGKGMRI
jgi:hypothetical protein